MRRYELWEMGNPGGKCHFFCALPRRRFGVCREKSTETRTDCMYIDLALPVDFHVSCQQPSMQTEK